MYNYVSGNGGEMAVTVEWSGVLSVVDGGEMELRTPLFLSQAVLYGGSMGPWVGPSGV